MTTAPLIRLLNMPSGDQRKFRGFLRRYRCEVTSTNMAVFVGDPRRVVLMIGVAGCGIWVTGKGWIVESVRATTSSSIAVAATEQAEEHRMKRSLGFGSRFLLFCFGGPARLAEGSEATPTPYWRPRFGRRDRFVVPGRLLPRPAPAVRAERLPHWNPRKPQASVSEPSTLLMDGLGPAPGAARFVRQ